MTLCRASPHRDWRPGDRLTRIEREMLGAAAAGERVDRGEGPFDLAAMKEWGPGRTVRAAVLRHLLVEEEWPVHAKGVQLHGVQISGHLDVEAETLCCPLRLELCYFSDPRPVNFDYATASLLALRCCQLAGLSGDVLTVTKELDLTGSTLTGQLCLLGADIGGQLICRDTRLAADRKALAANGEPLAADRKALGADNIKVGGDMLLDDKFTAAGTLLLRSAHIGGTLSLEPSKLAGGKDKDGKDRTAIDATGAQIAHELRWAPSKQVVGLVILEDATVGQLSDHWIRHGVASVNGYWPSANKGKLRLDGFTYTRTGGDHQARLEQRLAWIGSQHMPPLRQRVASAVRTLRTAWTANRQRPAGEFPRARCHRFVTQPYEQLAKVYRQAGQDKDARKVEIACRRDLRRYGELSRPRKLGNWLLDKTILYGYQTWRAVAGVIVLYAAVLAFLWFARYHNAIVPVQATTGLHPVPTAISCSSRYPCFNPFGYAIDTVIPLINVHQADFWGPNESVPWGTACAVVTYLGTGFGWLLATLAVVGYTGLARNTDDH